MPMFIKMGLHGTGFLGKQERAQRAARRFAARRKVLPGFPIEEPFQNIQEVRKYLSGDRMICLLCGKSFRRIGTHIEKMHGLTIEKYKEKYKIPWTYGLICSDSSQLYANAMKRRVDDGFEIPMKNGEDQKKMIEKEKRKTPFPKFTNKPKHPLTVSPSGKLETFTAKRERETAKKGTEAFSQKMRDRPQCQPKIIKEYFSSYWRGRKQTPEHIAKRFKKQGGNRNDP